MDPSSQYTRDYQVKLVRDKLNSDKIKLWLPPFTTEDGRKGEVSQEIVQKFSLDLKLGEGVVIELFEELRLHALLKLSEREKFKNSGLATIKIKLSGSDKCKEIFSLELSLETLGNDLREQIAKRISSSPNRIKLICSGHVIKDDISLICQSIKNGSQIMALYLSETDMEAQIQQERVAALFKTRQAAELLSSKAAADYDADTDYMIQIADQSGKPLNLPKEEKQALTLAMSLHEKGRSILKKKDYAQALLVLLEADNEFRKCRADILNAVDNYAVLCLDIVWCYFSLKNVEELPDADSRLQACEQCFQRSYGSNFERLKAVKGGTGSELGLVMKLHLLQGIVAFHQHRLQEAERFLHMAEEELQQLQIDENELVHVMSMGFKERESRLALRMCKGDVGQAISHIMKRRKEKDENRKKIRENRRKKSMEKSLGQTANGSVIDVEKYEQLCNMGFAKGAACEALKQSNNDLVLALEVLQNHPELLSLPDPVESVTEITEQMVAQVTAMGFDFEKAQQALKKYNANIAKAIEELVRTGGILSPDGASSSSSSTSTSSSSSSDDSSASSPVKTPEMIAQEREVLDSIMSDIPEDEEEYIDLVLEEETQVLEEYKTLVMSVSRRIS